MATNPYFNLYNERGEQNLVQDLVTEVIQNNGFDVFYCPRTIENLDPILGDDVLSSFDVSFQIEMMIEPETNTGFTGQEDFISKFGLEIRDSIKFVVSRARFDEVITRADETMIRPRTGDLVYFPFNKGLFEIKHVENEKPFYQLGKNYIWTLTLELYAANSEAMNTGVPEIDTIGGVLVTGTITSSDGSAVVIGTGTSFLSEAKIGQDLYTDSGIFLGRVLSIESDTQLTLESLAQATVADQIARFREASERSIGDNLNIETPADGSDLDKFQDDTIYRGTGVVNFDETSKFGKF